MIEFKIGDLVNVYIANKDLSIHSCYPKNKGPYKISHLDNLDIQFGVKDCNGIPRWLYKSEMSLYVVSEPTTPSTDIQKLFEICVSSSMDIESRNTCKMALDILGWTIIPQGYKLEKKKENTND